MQLTKLKPRKALNKAFLKVKPNRSDIESFKGYLIQLLDRTNEQFGLLKVKYLQTPYHVSH